MIQMERNYENAYLVTSPDEQVQKLLETMSDILVGTLYIAEKGDRIVADFASEIPDCRWHLESESILMDEEKKELIEIMDENGSWIFRSLSEKGV
jgi:hypothetical protein